MAVSVSQYVGVTYNNINMEETYKDGSSALVTLFSRNKNVCRATKETL